jgi:UDP-glucose 4-epimerase
VKVVVTGASGNVGSQVVRALRAPTPGDEVVGLSRRVPEAGQLSVEWRAADIVADDLTAHFAGADAVVHLAWVLQPSHDLATLQAVNVTGSARVFSAVAEAGVPRLVYASSVGAYSGAPACEMVEESWPTDGVPSSSYSRQKAYVERLLDVFECRHPEVAVARLRPGLVFQAPAAEEIRRYFAGPLLVNRLVRPRALPVLPWPRGLSFQAVHAEDLGAAFAAAVHAGARGAFNLAADPPLDGDVLAERFGARRTGIPLALLRWAAAGSFLCHLQPTEPGWLDLAAASPLMSTAKARADLAWQPARSSLDALDQLLEGLRRAEGFPTPPLDAASSGPGRVTEFSTGVGSSG